MSKLKRTFEELIEMISEYDELDGIGYEYLLDNIIDITQDLHDKGVEEGVSYTEIVQIVKRGEPVPKPFTTIMAVSYLTDSTYKLEVKTIKEIRWNDNGDIIVHIIGRKFKEKE